MRYDDSLTYIVTQLLLLDPLAKGSFRPAFTRAKQAFVIFILLLLLPRDCVAARCGASDNYCNSIIGLCFKMIDDG